MIQHIDMSNELQLIRHQEGLIIKRPYKVDSTDLDYFSGTGPRVEYIDAIPCNAYFMNLKSEIMRINSPTAESMRYNSLIGAIGQTVYDVCPYESAKRIIATDRAVLRTKRLQVVEDHVTFADDSESSFLTTKLPLYNEELEVIGVFGCSIQFGGQPFAKSLEHIRELDILSPSAGKINKCYLESLAKDDIALTPRERQILYLSLKGKSAKQVAEIINRSQRTVEDHIERCKQKLNVTTKSELIEKVFSLLLK